MRIVADYKISDPEFKFVTDLLASRSKAPLKPTTEEDHNIARRIRKEIDDILEEIESGEDVAVVIELGKKAGDLQEKLDERQMIMTQSGQDLEKIQSARKNAQKAKDHWKRTDPLKFSQWCAVLIVANQLLASYDKAEKEVADQNTMISTDTGADEKTHSMMVGTADSSKDICEIFDDMSRSNRKSKIPEDKGERAKYKRIKLDKYEGEEVFQRFLAQHHELDRTDWEWHSGKVRCIVCNGKPVAGSKYMRDHMTGQRHMERKRLLAIRSTMISTDTGADETTHSMMVGTADSSKDICEIFDDMSRSNRKSKIPEDKGERAKHKRIKLDKYEGEEVFQRFLAQYQELDRTDWEWHSGKVRCIVCNGKPVAGSKYMRQHMTGQRHMERKRLLAISRIESNSDKLI